MPSFSKSQFLRSSTPLIAIGEDSISEEEEQEMISKITKVKE